VFEIGGGEVHIFPGNYEDYLWRKENRTELSSEIAAATLSPTNGNGASPAAVEKKKINPYKLREMQDRLQHIEAEISRAEGQIGDCERALQTFVSAAETIRLNTLIEQRRSE